ncbi:MAG: iron-containing alcohol dehydrogenase [Marvinbryantia sp.]|jgi:alcohol dehydrogenase YqhD (iron-dependent ADH family)
MINFEFYNPTRIIFGKDVYKKVGEEVKKYGSRILMVYGGRSLKANGTYDEVKVSLAQAGITCFELPGVQPNPRLSLVQEGVRRAKEENVEMILAVGGGSVIDTAKAIAAGVYYDGDVWDFYTTEKQPEKVMNVGVILTIPAAGSESSDGSVITKEEDQMKCSCCTDLFFPKFAMLDPQLCFTLPEYQISSGGADILAHVMERYFVPDEHHDFSDRLCEAAMVSLIHNLPKVLKNKKDYEAWAEVMWIGNIAHNGLLGKGKRDDWGSHNIEHQISAHYDIAHGAGLAIIFPAWMKYVWKTKPEMMEQYAVRVWNVAAEGKTQEEVILEGIRCTEEFYHSIGLATRLSDVGIDSSDFEVMAKKAVFMGPLGNFKKLYKEDVMEIYKLAL